jgi:hypothetical protein
VLFSHSGLACVVYLDQQAGRALEKVSHSPWNPVTCQDIKYDFDALIAMGGRVNCGRVYTT